MTVCKPCLDGQHKECIGPARCICFRANELHCSAPSRITAEASVAGLRLSDVNEGINQALTTYHTSRGGNSNGLHVAQGSAPESDRHSAISELDGAQKRNGCVVQMDMPRNDAPPADESSASAAIRDSQLYSLAVFLGGVDALIQQVEGVLLRHRVTETGLAEVGQ